MSVGVMYIAVGESFVAEAAHSAASVKAQMPQLPIALVSNRAPGDSVFDTVVQVEQREYASTDRARLLMLSPFERTLYLDTDTFVCLPITELFVLLDRFDLAVAHGQMRVRDTDAETLADLYTLVPLSYPQFNTGVLLYKQSPAFAQFMQQWIDLNARNTAICTARGKEPPSNQTGFREALYLSDLRASTLTPEYHCRPGWVGFLSGQVKILHGRRNDLANAAKMLNRSTDQRVFVNFPGGLTSYTREELDAIPPPGRWTRLKNSLRTRGAAGTARVILKKAVAALV